MAPHRAVKPRIRKDRNPFDVPFRRDPVYQVLVDRFIYIIYSAACGVVSLLPLGLGFRLGSLLGWLSYWALPPYRRLVIANLTLAFGGEKSPLELRRLARRHFTNLGANIFSSVKFTAMTPEAIRKRVTVENIEAFNEARAAGKGVVWIASHMGNWELLASMAPQIFPVQSSTIYQRLGNPFIDADVRASRNRLGVLTFERKEGFTSAVALLRRGGTTAVLVDQHAGDAGLWCPLFGRLASTSPLAATLALRAGASLMTITVYTERPGYWRLVIGNPLSTTTRDVGLITANVNQALEEVVRRAPEDWFWVHNRWKTPNPNFLFAEYKRGVALPAGFAPECLKPFRVLVRSGNWLGDAVMSTPAVQAIARGRPDLHLTVLTRAKLADYWRRVPEVKEVITMEPNESVFTTASKLRGKFEVAIVLPNSIRTALEPWLSGIPRRVGYPAKWRQRFLNQVMPLPKPETRCRPARHQVHHYLELAATLGAEPALTGKAVQTTAFQRTSSAGGILEAPGRIKIGLCPGAEFGPAKRWLPERFAEVAETVSRQLDCEWVLFGVAGDLPAGEEIARCLEGRVTNLIGKTTLAELMDRLAECRLLLTNDTGTMHLAAFLGVPTVAIFGSTEPTLTGPLGSGHQVLRHQVECSPCFLRECPLDFRCMKAVTVEETVAAVMRAL